MGLYFHFKHKPHVVQAASADIFDMLNKGKIKPKITQTYLLEDFATALGQFSAKKSIGKMVMTTGRD